MPPLPSDQRRQLEKAIVEARRIAEGGATEALQALAVHHHEPHGSMSADQRTLRNRLRAHGRQLGDVLDKQRGGQTIHRLAREVAYEHWHRMLFARFLAENDLLIHPKARVPVSLGDVQELAREERADPWELAASYAQHMLPEIFRADDPVLRVTLPPEVRQAMQKLLADLPATVFTADDSLGWTYQFWQASEKDIVNKSGEKITGETLPAVTQLFTEHYMVEFLLHNTIGAWWAGRRLTPADRANAASEAELRERLALPGVSWDYLRFVREAKEGEDLNAGTGPWRPASGTYDTWPKAAAQLRVLDPCCGSGHFLVAGFDLLVRLRIAEQGLDIAEAIRGVLADNIFGLELDPRCTQIAAFNLAFAAWKMAGKPIDLPPLNIACSGVGPQSTKDEWLKMAEPELVKERPDVREAMRRGLAHMHELFSDAPELGSLIDPNELPAEGFAADFETIKPLLDRILAAESGDEEARERAVAARGMATVAEILTGDYTLVVTNVPYLGRSKQSSRLRDFSSEHHEDARADLSTTLLARSDLWLNDAGTVAVVSPQNWWFLSSYSSFRRRFESEHRFHFLATLGEEAWQAFGDRGPLASLLIASRSPAPCDLDIATIDALAMKTIAEKILSLMSSSPRRIGQAALRNNPDCRFSFERIDVDLLLEKTCNSWQGLVTTDNPRFMAPFWEVPKSDDWVPYISSPSGTKLYAGRESYLRWCKGSGPLHDDCSAHNFPPPAAMGQHGVLLAQVRSLDATVYTGEIFANGSSPVVPNEAVNIAALWCFLSSEEYASAVRKIDKKTMVTNGSLLKVEFDYDRWRDIAQSKYPNGLPEPQSDDPTQWLFHGRPERADLHAALQVGVARLVGYRWPAELDSDMRLAPEARALVRRCDELLPYADEDGIVCLPAIRGEPAAADRLRKLLAAAFGPNWNLAKEKALLAAAAEANKDKKPAANLDEWLRESFFEQHCKGFHHRPFVWHVWDGLKDGFSALVNYHKLAEPNGEGRKTLESLTFSYLGDWISVQTAEMKAGTPGADARLAAAQDLQAQFKLILEGEPPYDIFVRWKPLAEQPAGWNPDINDGVRLNIRPFLSADLRKGKKGAGVLRWKPNVKWTKDRGQEPQSLRPKDQFPWFWGWDEGKQSHATDFGSGLKDTAPASKFDGNRWNDLHYTKAAKEAARARP